MAWAWWEVNTDHWVDSKLDRLLNVNITIYLKEAESLMLQIIIKSILFIVKNEEGCFAASYSWTFYFLCLHFSVASNTSSWRTFHSGCSIKVYMQYKIKLVLLFIHTCHSCLSQISLDTKTDSTVYKERQWISVSPVVRGNRAKYQVAETKWRLCSLGMKKKNKRFGTEQAQQWQKAVSSLLFISVLSGLHFSFPSHPYRD